MNHSGASGIPPPPPTGGASNITSNSNNNSNRGKNLRGRGHGGGRGGRGGRVGGRGGGSPGRGGFHGMQQQQHHGGRFGSGGGGGNIPPPPPPPNNRGGGNQWRDNSGGGRSHGNNGNHRNNFRNGRGRGDGNMMRGGGGGRRGGSPMSGGGRGRGDRNFHHNQQHHQNQKQFHQGPPGSGGGGHGHPFPPGPPLHPQQPNSSNSNNNMIPPPPPHSNYGPQQQPVPNMRAGPRPPPPPPSHNNNNYHPQHVQQQQMPHQQQQHSSIPPPPPRQHQHHSQQQWQQQIPPSATNYQHQQQPQQQQQAYHLPSPLANNQQLPYAQQQQQQRSLQHPQFPNHLQQQCGPIPLLQQQRQRQQQQLYPVQPQQPATTSYTQHHQQKQQPTTFQAAITSNQFNNSYKSNTTDPELIAGNWTTHTAPSGVNYFYNTITKRSTYDKPPCLSSSPNTFMAGMTATTTMTHEASAASTKKQTTSKERGWTQHTDKASGKVYYYNGVTTTWEKPLNMNSITTTASAATTSSSSLSSTNQPSKKKRKKENDKSSSIPTLYNNKAEAIAAFKGLLLAKDISPTMKWNDVLKLCSADNRWNACSSTGERKQALAEYQTKRAAELREQKRQEKVRAKDAFHALLREVLPTVQSFHPSDNTRFEEIRDSLSTDDRFYAVEEEEMRHELYFDFVEELRKREERQRRGKKREAKDGFLAFLKSREEIGSLTFATTWKAFKMMLLNAKDKEDPRVLVSAAMSDSDQQLYFADYIIELNTAEEEKQRRIQEARLRAEKAQRNAYRDALKSMAKEGKILPSSRWRNCEEEIIALDSFGPVNDKDKNTPRDMFEDFVYDWADDYRKDKSFLSSLVERSKDAIVDIDTTYDDFKKSILKAAEYSQDTYTDARKVINNDEPISSTKLFFDEMVLKVKNGNAMFAKRRRPYGRRGDDSSEDEGEIVEEDGEVVDEPIKSANEISEKQSDTKTLTKEEKETTSDGSKNEKKEENNIDIEKKVEQNAEEVVEEDDIVE